MVKYINLCLKQKIIESVKIGTSIQEIRKQFEITEGQVIDILYHNGMYGTADATLGSKRESYFEGDFPPEIPNYSVKELSGEERKILIESYK